MCDPLTLGGIALSALSTGMNYAAQQKVEAARKDAMNAESVRQRALDHEAAGINAGSRNRYKNVDDQEAKSAKSLGDYFTGQSVPSPSKENALPVSASNVTVNEENKQRGQAKQFTDKTGKALGELRSFGDVLGNNSLLQARDAGQVGQIGGFKTGSSNVLGYELDDANHKGDGLKAFGDIVGGIGGLVTQKGLSSAPPFQATGSLGDLLGAAPRANVANSLMPIGRTLDRNSIPGYARL